MYACFYQYNATKYKLNLIQRIKFQVIMIVKICCTREINKIHFAVVLIRHDFLPHLGIKDCAVFTNSVPCN